MLAHNVSRACSAVLALLCSLPLGATTVYRSVDENGVVSFSDMAPEDGSTAEKLQIDAPAPQSDDTQQQRLEDMRKTTDRMAADRREREKHRAEMRKLAAQNQPPQYVTEYLPQTIYTGGYSGYYRKGYRPGYGHRPGYGRPEHPIVRPPLRPPQNRPGVRPLPSYNQYPASLIRRSYQPAVRDAFRTPRR